MGGQEGVGGGEGVERSPPGAPCSQPSNTFIQLQARIYTYSNVVSVSTSTSQHHQQQILACFALVVQMQSQKLKDRSFFFYIIKKQPNKLFIVSQ